MDAARKKFICKILLSFLSAVSLCACQPSPDGVLRMGYLQSDLHHLPAFVALEKGLFKKEGLDVRVSGVFKAGPEEMTAFGAGELDFGYVGQAPATAALLNSAADIEFIAQVNREGSAIVAHREPGTDSLRALSGKSIAIPGHATIQEYLLSRALAGAAMQPRDIKTIVLKPPEMLQALKQKNIDAFIAWQPYPAQANRAGGAGTILDSKSIWKDHPCCVLIAHSSLCRTRPDAVRKIRAAHSAACAFIAGNPAEALAIAQKYTGLERPVLEEALRHIQFTEQLDRERSFEFVKFLKARGYVPAGVSDDLFYKAFFTETATGD